MAKFLMLGKYTLEAVKGISAQRTKKVEEIFKAAGGRTEAIYALMGNYDLAFLVDLPGTKEAIKASVALARLTGIGFTTSPIISVEEFDQLAV